MELLRASVPPCLDFQSSPETGSVTSPWCRFGLCAHPATEHRVRQPSYGCGPVTLGRLEGRGRDWSHIKGISFTSRMILSLVSFCLAEAFAWPRLGGESPFLRTVGHALRAAPYCSVRTTETARSKSVVSHPMRHVALRSRPAVVKEPWFVQYEAFGR
jgi:hypothetical protein